MGRLIHRLNVEPGSNRRPIVVARATRGCDELRPGSLARPRLVALCALVTLIGCANAAEPAGDCREGADFIANAARSRDNGMPRDAFMGRLEDDLVVIRAFPPAMRWFAKNVADERFLLQAAAQVFDAPLSPARHHAAFLAACLARAAT